MKTIETTITMPREKELFGFTLNDKKFTGNPAAIEFTRPLQPGDKVVAEVSYVELTKVNVIKKVTLLRAIPNMLQSIVLLQDWYVNLVREKMTKREVVCTNSELIAKTKRFPSLDVIKPEYSTQPNCELYQYKHEISVSEWRRNPLVPEVMLVCNGKPVGYLNKSGKRLQSLVDEILDLTHERA